MSTTSGSPTGASNTLIPSDLPQNMQPHSRLVQLPAELRIKILRLLLRFTNHYGIDSYRGRTTSPIKQARSLLRTCVRLMQTCQMLLNEGGAILYDENVIALYLHLWYEDTIDIRSPIIGFSFWNSNIEFVDFFVLEPERWEDFYDNDFMIGDEDLDGEECLDLCSTLHRLQHYELVLQSWFVNKSEQCCFIREEQFEELLFYICRLSRGLLQNRHMTIKFDTNRSASEILQSWPHTLDGCNILTCGKSEIKDMDTPCELKQQVESRRKVHDTYADWYLFHVGLILDLPELSWLAEPDHYFFDHYRSELVDLWTVAWRYDPHAYVEARRKVIKLAECWMGGETHSQHLKSEVTQTHRVIEFLRESEGQNIKLDSEPEACIDSLIQELTKLRDYLSTSSQRSG